MNYHSVRSLTVKTELDSEGFLYIDNTHKSYDSVNTFKLGEITDTTGTIICPGEIVSIMDYEEFESNKTMITHFSKVLVGKKVRIYIFNDIVIISRENEIYPQELMSEDEIKKQINFDLLDKNKCYYATIVIDINKNYKIILTYITDVLDPTLEIPDLSHDLAFTHHNTIYVCINNSAMDTFRNEYNKQDNGIIFYRNDGQRFEFWSPIYSAIKCQERPYYISPNEYYILLLNKYPLGKTYESFFKDLHYDVDIYLKHYPEDTYLFDLMEGRLNIYANFKVDYLTPLLEDCEKIKKLKDLLCIDDDFDVVPEEVANVLIKFNNNCNKRTSV